MYEKNSDEEINVVFFGDIFGDPGINVVKKYMDEIKAKYNPDFLIAQAENVSGRKGFRPEEYQKLKDIGINAFTLGNHVWAEESIKYIIDNDDIIRPANIKNTYPGSGYREFKVKNFTIGIVSIMGIQFNILLNPWNEESADDFFAKIDEILSEHHPDFVIIDFHGETTSEKNVFSLYCDGKVSAVLGTHTHVQTNDARILPNGTYYCTDVGMCGPHNSAIGANYKEVYEKMRYGSRAKFQISPNSCHINAIYFKLTKDKNKQEIKLINIIE
ncbi:YmdB family metallophosphoesterase [Mycoplasma zalophi]|uniref:YmdB family metallophosphoesterase n=1 Tax=Mycoplasma zalophi TaxID=191287 RepID=A0ABS6DQ72_9MOLU|nr:TIGR00282 family metallophosphoesterase [Mycoplasma zalophi]MBU4692477.1 YmdB family metallophosphoesterase [Mycoplasma zalophi]